MAKVRLTIEVDAQGNVTAIDSAGISLDNAEKAAAGMTAELGRTKQASERLSAAQEGLASAQAKLARLTETVTVAEAKATDGRRLSVEEGRAYTTALETLKEAEAEVAIATKELSAAEGEHRKQMQASKKAAQELKQQAEELKQAYGTLGTQAGIVGGAMIVGISGAAVAAGKYGQELLEAADKTGVSVEQISALRYAAEQSGVSLSQLETGFGGLARSSASAANAQVKADEKVIKGRQKAAEATEKAAARTAAARTAETAAGEQAALREARALQSLQEARRRYGVAKEGEPKAKAGASVQSAQLRYQEAQRAGSEMQARASERVATAQAAEDKAREKAVGGMKIAEGAYSALGVQIGAQEGSLRSSYEVFLEAADAISQEEDALQQSAIAQQMFGESGRELLPLLIQGRAAIQAHAEEAKRLGIVWDKDTAQAADRFMDSVGGAKRAVQSLGAALFVGKEGTKGLLDSVNGLIGGMSNFLRDHPTFAKGVASIGLVAGGALVGFSLLVKGIAWGNTIMEAWRTVTGLAGKATLANTAVLQAETGALAANTAAQNANAAAAAGAGAARTGGAAGGIPGAGAGVAARGAGVVGQVARYAAPALPGAIIGYRAAERAIQTRSVGRQAAEGGGAVLKGAAAGAAIGSIVPGVGTAVGAVVGGAAAGVVGVGRLAYAPAEWKKRGQEIFARRDVEEQQKRLAAMSPEERRRYLQEFQAPGAVVQGGGTAAGRMAAPQTAMMAAPAATNVQVQAGEVRVFIGDQELRQISREEGYKIIEQVMRP